MATTLGLAAPRPRAATTAGALRTHLAAAAVGVAYALALLVLAGGIVPLPILAPGTFRPLPGRSFLWQPTAHLFLFVWWPTWLRAAGVGALVGWTAHRVASARPRAHPAWLLPAVAALLTGYTCCAMTVPAAGLWLHCTLRTRRRWPAWPSPRWRPRRRRAASQVAACPGGPRDTPQTFANA